MFAFFFTVLGAVIGSFAGVVSERLHTGESWVRDRSRCNSCARELGVGDLVPVLSWLASFGRCRSCGSNITALYVVVEAALAVVFYVAYSMLGLGLPLFLFLGAVSALTVIVLYDVRHTVVPPGPSIVFGLLSLGFALSTMVSLASFGLALACAGVVGLCFFLAYFLSSGRVMGLGDAPIAFSLSLLAAGHVIPGILFSFWIGGIVGIVILVTRPKGHRMGIEVPFVPFLAAGFLLAFFTSWNPLALVTSY